MGFNYGLTDYSSVKTLPAVFGADLVGISVSNINEDIYNLLVICLGNTDRIMIQKCLDSSLTCPLASLTSVLH